MLPPTVRLRLTLLYGLLFITSGAVLLGITYLMVRAPGPHHILLGTYRSGPAGSAPLPSPPESALDYGRAVIAREHALELHRLLERSGLALLIMSVVSVALGWWLAGRVLRPLRAMTAAIRRISARNVHERLAATGPRDEMTELSDTVDALLGRLETALDAQRRFVANAAHELRTPLTLQHALLEEALLDDTIARDNFDRLLVLARQQAALLESLLTLAESERDLSRREAMDLGEVAERVLHTCATGDVTVSARLDASPVHGDQALVERLVANLLDNAAGYNRPAGSVSVRTRTTGGQALLEVVNTGPLVPASQVDRLFQPFQRLDRTSSRADHHGLGLSIVAAIAAVHGATIRAVAPPGGGLSVRVTFPRPDSPN